jgi:peptide deformylase
MKELNLVYFPDKLLRKVCEPLVAPYLPEAVKNKLRGMLELTKIKGGVGMAAPQIGWSAAAFCINTPDFTDICINPEIKTDVTKDVATHREGCLSLPGISVAVTRVTRVQLAYRNLDGEIVTKELEKLAAIVAQHEYDHLLGKLIIDRAEPGSIKLATDLKPSDWKRRLKKDGSRHKPW